MARKRVTHYAVFHNIGKTSSINIYYQGGGADTIKNLSIEEASYIIDLLRNEKPISYDHSRKRLSTLHAEPIGEGEGGYLEPLFNLDNWLNSRRYIRDFINFELPNGTIYNYNNWTSLEKSQLANYYYKVLRLRETGVSETPELISIPNDNDIASTNISRDTAWNYYLAFVAQSLVVEADKRINWSVQHNSEEEKELIFDSRSLFLWNSNMNYYYIPITLGFVSPGDPFRIYRFLLKNQLIGNNHLQTVTRLVNWSRQLRHFSGNRNVNNIYDQWQYKGFPPIERVINGTTQISRPLNGIKKRTGGCRGTTGFLRMCLRTVNIPVKLEIRAGHALPNFVSIQRYLSHGDDPYNQMFKNENQIPTSRLLIDQNTWDNWFGVGVNHRENIGRQVRELALEFLPNYILKLHCKDLAENRNHANSRVFEVFKRNYSVQQLETKKLWQRMDHKINSLGGCSIIE